MVKRKKLTQKQAEVLRLLNLGCSVREVAKRQKVTTQAVYKMLYRLEDLGVLNYATLKRGLVYPKQPNLRLHGLQYQIKILYQSPVYRKTKEKSNIITFGDFKLALFKNSLTLWILKDFIGEKAADCKGAASEYLYKTLAFIERKYNIVLVKRGYQNIKEVRAHYAAMNNSLAKKAIKENQPTQIRDPKDGKVWLSIDNSIYPPELETQHKDSSYIDMKEIIEPFFTILKTDPYFFNKQTFKVEKLIKITESNSAQVSELTKALKTLISAMASFMPKPNEEKQSPPREEEPPDYIG